MSILKVLKDFFVTESYYDSRGYFHSMPPETKEVVADTYTVSTPTANFSATEVKEKVSTSKRVQRTKVKEKGATIKPPITTSTLEN